MPVRLEDAPQLRVSTSRTLCRRTRRRLVTGPDKKNAGRSQSGLVMQHTEDVGGYRVDPSKVHRQEPPPGRRGPWFMCVWDFAARAGGRIQPHPNRIGHVSLFDPRSAPADAERNSNRPSFQRFLIGLGPGTRQSILGGIGA